MDRPYQWHQWMLHGREEDSPSPHSLFWRQCVMVSRDPEKNLNTRKKTSQFRSLAHCGSCRGFGTREHNHLIQGNKGCLYIIGNFATQNLREQREKKWHFQGNKGTFYSPREIFITAFLDIMHTTTGTWCEISYINMLRQSLCFRSSNLCFSIHWCTIP